MSILEAIHPVLMSRDVSVSVSFYQRLGFSLRFHDRPSDPKYAVVTRDAVELHLQWQDESHWTYPIDRPTYRFLVQNVDELYSMFRKTGAIADQVSSDGTYATPRNTPWGTREFHLRDPGDNGLQFYRPL